MRKFFNFTLVYSFLIALILCTSCKNRDFKDYIEQGFSKPSVEDVHFNISNKGSENKIYVPSAQEIEVEFTIKNRYEKELKGEILFDESASSLFNAPPHIKELTPKKMVIAFNFKAEGEPSSQNAFLGVSVPISLKIFDKKTGRFLSGQNVTANCNTPPLPVLESDITYVEGDDKYIVKLPKINGIHKDLKEVKFFLSSAYGNENVKPKTVSIDDTTQDTLYTLNIKGRQDWQLENPSGDRKIKAIVYDKAGLKSGEGLKNASRIFTSITLEPPLKEISLEDIVENGVPVPEIKELKEFFNGDDWKKAGYKVKYENPNFSYDETDGKLKQKGKLSTGEHDVVVTLEHGGNQPNAIYKIKTNLNIPPSINQNKLKITDETKYEVLIPPNGAKSLELSGENIVFSDEGGVKVGTLIVPYTGFETNLKVHLEANSNHQKIKLGEKEKEVLEAELTLEKDSESPKVLHFFVTTLASNVQQEYKITFTRGASVTVNVSCVAELLQSTCKVVMSWKYAQREVTVDNNLTVPSSSDFKVAIGAKVKFEITAGEGDRIKSCSSDDDQHSQIDVNNDKKMSFELTANENFTLSVTFRAEASFKWVDIGGDNSKGYQSVHVSYHLNNAIHNEKYGITPQPTPEKAIKKNKECKFWIKELDQKYIVTKWEVNGDEIKQDGGDFKVSNDLTSLTIDYPDKDYVVKVFTTELCKLELKVCNSGGTEITDHNYTFEVRKDSSNGALIPQSPANHCEGIMAGTKLYITAKAGTKTDYEIEKWQKRENGGSSFTDLPFDGGKDKTKFNITKDTIVRLILKKKELTLNVIFDTQDNHGYSIKANKKGSTTEITPTGYGDYSSKKYEIEAGTEVELEANTSSPNIKYSIVEWQIKKGSGFTKIAGSEGKNKIEITMEKNTEIQVVLAPEYIFTLKKKPNGKLKITNSDGSKVFGTLAANGNKSISTKEDIYFEITDLTGYDLVVSYKINDSEDDNRVKALFDETKGFWKVERQKLALNPCETFEVNIARFHRINISVRDYADNSKLYEGNEFTLKVSKTAGVGRLFPKFSNGDEDPLEIKKRMIDNANKYCTVYVPKGVTLRFDMEGLDGRGKEIGVWDGSLSLINDINTFNDEPDNPDLKKGKDSNIQYTFPPSYQNDAFTLNACIRDKTAVLTVKLLKYTEGNDENKLHSDDSCKLTIIVTQTGLIGGTLTGNSESECKKRVFVNKEVKLEAISSSDYYFAYWKHGTPKYSMSKTFTMPNGDHSIDTYWSNVFIVRMHKILKDDENNFPNTNIENEGEIGTTAVMLFNNDNGDNGMQSWKSVRNNKEESFIPVPKEGKNVSIRNVTKIKLQAIEQKPQNKSVQYYYVFGDDNRPKSTTRVDDTGQTTNTRLVLVEIGKNDVRSAILHIWLHRWWY
ncbi:MAG: InlB B-repeat-containing protein [Treponema sp.]